MTRNQEGWLAYVHWGCDKGIYVSFKDTDTNEIIPMDTGCQFVIDQRCVKLGALCVLKMHRTD